MRTVKTDQFLSLLMIAVILLAGFSSCNNSAKKNSSTEVKETIKKEIEEYAYPLPSSFEVTNMLNEIEASYIVGITNDPEKYESYFSEKSKALNLGIYTADLAYTTTYNKKSDIQNYFKASEALVRELDFTAAFSQDLPDQMEANMDNKDQLVELITGMFQNAYSFLNKQGRTEISYLVLTGTVIEGLYLTTHISENTFQNPKIIEAVLFQKKPLQDLAKMMENFKESELLKEAYQDIQALNAIYSMEEGTTSMTEKQMIELTKNLTLIRDRYVQ